MHKVLVVRKRQELTYFEPDKQLAHWEHVILAEEIMEILPICSFYVLLASWTHTGKSFPKHMVNEQSSYTLCIIAGPEVILRELQVVNEHENDTVILDSTNSRQEPRKEETQDDTANTEWQDRIKIRE